MTSGARLVAVLALASVSCAKPFLSLPDGPGTAAPDARAALATATEACRGVSAFTAVAGISGRIRGERLRARLLLGLATPAEARIEALAFGRPVFVLAARGDVTTLLWQREDRVLEDAPTGDVIEALTGLPLGAAALRAALTGCADVAGGEGARQHGPNRRTIVGASQVLYLERRAADAPWRLVVIVHRGEPEHEWRAEYRDFDRAGGLPRTIRWASREGARFDVRLELSQVEINVPIAPEAFRVAVPAGAHRMTLRELWDEGPFGGAPRFE